jgi:hypothetical protein
VKGKIRRIDEKIAVGKLARGGNGAKSSLAKPPRLCCIAVGCIRGVRIRESSMTMWHFKLGLLSFLCLTAVPPAGLRAQELAPAPSEEASPLQNEAAPRPAPLKPREAPKSPEQGKIEMLERIADQLSRRMRILKEREAALAARESALIEREKTAKEREEVSVSGERIASQW